MSRLVDRRGPTPRTLYVADLLWMCAAYTASVCSSICVRVLAMLGTTCSRTHAAVVLRAYTCIDNATWQRYWRKLTRLNILVNVVVVVVSVTACYWLAGKRTAWARSYWPHGGTQGCAVGRVGRCCCPPSPVVFCNLITNCVVSRILVAGLSTLLIMSNITK